MTLLDGLKGYGTWFGPAHEKDCPADDTCQCRGKPFNDAVNKIIAESRIVEDTEPLRDLRKRWAERRWNLAEYENVAKLMIAEFDEALAGIKTPRTRCSDCKMEVGEQHRPSCHRQGLVTTASDYRDATTCRQLVFTEVEAFDAEAVFCLACDAVLQTEDAPRVTRAKHNAARHQSDQCIFIALRGLPK